MANSKGNDKAALLLNRLGDLTLRINTDGVITAASVHRPESFGFAAPDWQGQLFQDTLDEQTSGIGTEMLRVAQMAAGEPVQRNLVHMMRDGSGLPVQYVCIYDSEAAEARLVGKDQRTEFELRQQLVNAQQALEQDYWRLRQVETRYRKALELNPDAFLVIDAGSRRVLDANAAASRVLSGGDGAIVGRTLSSLLDERANDRFERAFEAARNLGFADLGGVVVGPGNTVADVTVTLLRQDRDLRMVVSIRSQQPISPDQTDTARLPPLFGDAADGMLLINAEGMVLSANRAIVHLIEAPNTGYLLAKPAQQWIGGSGVDMNVLMTNLRQRGTVRLFGTVLCTESSLELNVEISASTHEGPNGPTYLLVVRDVARRVGSGVNPESALPRSLEQLRQRVGRVPLKQLVRESTDVIEEMCIEAALDLTYDNRAAAAEMLGLSRQSLYSKLRRYQIDGVSQDLDADS